VTELTLPARAIVQSTPRTRIISADLGEREFEFVAGQAVFAGLAESTVRRPYSIACSPSQSRRSRVIELLVQIDDHAAPDPHLERAAVGTLLRIEGPFGTFSLPDGVRTEPLLLIAGGTGIAPLRSMMWNILESQPGRDISVLYSARGPEEFAYGEELAHLQAAGRIVLVRTVTRDTGSDWDGSRGRMNRALIGTMLKTPATQCVICGPAALVADATEILKSHGVAETLILTETYAT
jgi:phenol hydroxylase P5 protein